MYNVVIIDINEHNKNNINATIDTFESVIDSIKFAFFKYYEYINSIDIACYENNEIMDNLRVLNIFNIEELKNIQINEHIILCMCENKYTLKYCCEKYDYIYTDATHDDFERIRNIDNKYFHVQILYADYVEIIYNDSEFFENKFEIVEINK